MELLIAGGIALMGYNMSPTPRRSSKRRADVLGPSNEYHAPGNDTSGLTRQHIDLATRRWQQSRDAALTGVVSPHTKLTNAALPFFTSAKKQNTNASVKQTKMELFTGANTLAESATGTYRKKQEVEAMFPTTLDSGQVNSEGRIASSMIKGREDDRFVPSVMQQGVLPAQQIRVGPGVGVAPDVSATDGFHPMHRVMLKNVGEYKKNNLPGRTNHGFHMGKTPQTAPKVAVNKNPGALVMDLERRPLMPVSGPVTAPAQRSTVGPVRRARLVDDERFGNPARVGPDPRGQNEDRLGYESGRDHPDRNHVLPMINLSGTAAATTAGTGAFTHASFDVSKICAQQREAPGTNGFLTGPVSRSAAPGFVVPPTQRAMTNAAGYVMGPGGTTNAQGLAVQRSDDAKHTLRETVNASAVFGATAAVKGGMLDNVWRYKRLGREPSRGAMADWAPLPARVNVTQPMQGTAMRDDTLTATKNPLPTLPNTYTNQLGTQTIPDNKLPSANPRLDLGIAVTQLRDNPYAKSLWTA